MNLRIDCAPGECAASFSFAECVYRACKDLLIDVTTVAKMMLLEAESVRKDGADNDTKDYRLFQKTEV